MALQQSKNDVNGSGAIDRKHLLWLAALSTALVTVSVFFYTENRAYTKDSCIQMQREMDIRYSNINKNLEQILDEIKEIRATKK